MPTQSELIDHAISRIGDASDYWNFFIVVVSAIIGLMASGRSLVRQRRVRGALAILFAIFAVGNLFAIYTANEQRAAFVALLTQPGLEGVANTLRPVQLITYGGYHLILDIVTILIIVLVPWPVEPKSKA